MENGLDRNVMLTLEPTNVDQGSLPNRFETRDFDGLFNMGAKIIMKGHQNQSNKMKLEYFNPNGKPFEECVEDFTTFAHADSCPNINFEADKNMIELRNRGWNNLEVRKKWATVIFQKSAVYLKKMVSYCDLTGSPRNIQIFSELSEHLSSLISGMKGTRSGSKGADLVEPGPLLIPSEVKSCVGRKGDFFGREDKSVYDLINFDHHEKGTERRLAKEDKLYSWRRLFFVRWQYEQNNLLCAIHTLDEAGIGSFHRHIASYGFNTMLQYNCSATELIHSEIKTSLFRNKDNLGVLQPGHVCTIDENSGEILEGDYWNEALGYRRPCVCSWCNAHQFLRQIQGSILFYSD